MVISKRCKGIWIWVYFDYRIKTKCCRIWEKSFNNIQIYCHLQDQYSARWNSKKQYVQYFSWSPLQLLITNTNTLISLLKPPLLRLWICNMVFVVRVKEVIYFAQYPKQVLLVFSWPYIVITIFVYLIQIHEQC